MSLAIEANSVSARHCVDLIPSAPHTGSPPFLGEALEQDNRAAGDHEKMGDNLSLQVQPSYIRASEALWRISAPGKSIRLPFPAFFSWQLLWFRGSSVLYEMDMTVRTMSSAAFNRVCHVYRRISAQQMSQIFW
jgi:hypothetical protein